MRRAPCGGSGHGATFFPNSVLVTCIGSTVGKTASPANGATNQHINAICCPPQIAGFAYLACVAAHDTIVANAGKQAVPSSTAHVLRNRGPALSQAEMIEISAMVDAIEMRSWLAQLRYASSHKHALMSDLLSGRVRVPENRKHERISPCREARARCAGGDGLAGAVASRRLAMRVEENRVILKPVLIAALRDLNSIGEADAEAIYADLATLSDNEDWQRKLRGGYSRRLTGENRDSPITLIDFKNPARNQFHVTRQFRVAAQRPRIPDVVLFVNGIPLVVIEAKSPLKATARAEEAFEQIKQYERDIPRLFAPNAFNIVTDGMATLYGATGSPAQFYAPWPDAWPRTRADFPDDLSKDLWCLCEPSRLLDLLAHFIVFEVDPETGRKIKKVCRYQQFRAVNKAVERVAAGEHRKGLIWHTQGSGKSLTMVFLALKLKTHLTLDAPSLANPNILVLTDRIDLDDQISKTFVACGLPNPRNADRWRRCARR
jgi:hypothetical protein